MGLTTAAHQQILENRLEATWNVPVRNFCESYHHHHHHHGHHEPEYWSAYSSLFITAFALYGLYGRGNTHHNSLTKLCFGILAWCGIGSFGFHWTLVEGWSFLDTFPMTLCTFLGLYMGWVVMAQTLLTLAEDGGKEMSKEKR